MDRPRREAGGKQPLPREAVQVDAPVARPRRGERDGGFFIARDEGVAHLQVEGGGQAAGFVQARRNAPGIAAAFAVGMDDEAALDRGLTVDGL